MATASTFTDGSDAADDFPCSSCRKDNKHVESVKFCMECKDYLCQTCLSYHSKFSSTADHAVIDKSKVLVPKQNVTGVDISFRSDVFAPCDVPGLCLITRGADRYVVLTDWKNKMVKFLSMKDKKVIEAVTLEDKPYGVIELPSSGLVVITVRDRDELAFIDYARHHLNWEVKTYFTSKHSRLSRGVAVIKGHYNDNLLVVNGASEGANPSLNVFASAVDPLKAMGLELEVLYPIHSESLERHSFSSHPKNIAVSRDFKKLYITNELVGVIITDVKGKKIGILKNSLLQRARGICTDDVGNIYVSGTKSENVVKFSPEEKLIGEVVNSSHGLKCPISLCYDNSTHSLIIGSMDKIPVRIVKL